MSSPLLDPTTDQLLAARLEQVEADLSTESPATREEAPSLVDGSLNRVLSPKSAWERPGDQMLQ